MPSARSLVPPSPAQSGKKPWHMSDMMPSGWIVKEFIVCLINMRTQSQSKERGGTPFWAFITFVVASKIIMHVLAVR